MRKSDLVTIISWESEGTKPNNQINLLKIVSN